MTQICPDAVLLGNGEAVLMLADYRHRAAHAGGKGIQRHEGEGADVMRYVEQFASDWAVIISGQRKIEWLNFGSLFGVVGEEGGGGCGDVVCYFTSDGRFIYTLWINTRLSRVTVITVE